jgi:hypothetical protein
MHIKLIKFKYLMEQQISKIVVYLETHVSTSQIWKYLKSSNYQIFIAITTIFTHNLYSSIFSEPLLYFWDTFQYDTLTIHYKRIQDLLLYATYQPKRADLEGKILFGNILISALYGYENSKVLHSSHVTQCMTVSGDC